MHNIKRKLILMLLILLVSLYTVSTVSAQEGYPTDDDVNRIAKQLYCPVCPNTPLDVCETKACEDWRAQIRDLLSQGWTDQQIIDYFVAQYGERVLAEPRRRGFTSLVWFLPLVVVLIGAGIVYEVLKGWRAQRVAPQATAPPPQIEPTMLEKIERELRDMN